MTEPLKHAIIACRPDERSFTLAIANRYAEAVHAHDHEAVVRDLYKLGFDPVLKLEERAGEPAADVVAEWDALGEIDVRLTGEGESSARRRVVGRLTAPPEAVFQPDLARRDNLGKPEI